MGPVEAITTCLRKSFRFSGRASRAEFWWFAPLATALPVLAVCLIPRPPALWHLAVVLAAAMPLLSAGARRLQDTGEPGHSIMLPIAPLLYFFAALWLISSGFNVTLGGTPWFIAWPLVFLFWIIFPFVCFASLFWVGPILGQLLLPSDSRPNRYGPNPLEVTP